MIKKQAEDLTKAYIHSYNLAMEEVRNPEFATVQTGRGRAGMSTMSKGRIEAADMGQVMPIYIWKVRFLGKPGYRCSR